MRTTFRESITLITGAAGGLGRALAGAAARRGAHVVLAARQLAEAEEVARQIRDQRGTARAVELDVRDAVALETVVRDVMKAWGRIDAFAERVLDQVAVNVRLIIVPRWWRALWWLDRLAPPLGEEVWRALFARGRKLAGTP